MVWTPKFASPDLEREYQASLVNEKIRLARIVAILGGGLDLCFVILDLWAIPSALTAVWCLRAGILATMIGYFASTRLRDFYRYYPVLTGFAFIVMGAAMNLMILLAEPGEAAIEEYFGGLLLVAIGLHTMTYLHLGVSLALSLSMLAVYAAVVALIHGHTSGHAGVVLASNLFVGVSAMIIGIVAQALRDRYARDNFLLRHSLQRDVELKEEENRRASYLADHDPLTGLCNRLHFEREIQTMLDDAARNGTEVALMFVDLDAFKPVNDRYGHAVGDRVLRVIAERLQSRLRGNDLCARFGGDEFLVAVEHHGGDHMAVRAAAARLADAIALDVEVRGAAIRITASIGIAGYPDDGRDLDTLLKRADERMYEVKRRGGNDTALPPGWREENARAISG
jgi:diguanylate cyclase (GGDEF)-like protein